MKLIGLSIIHSLVLLRESSLDSSLFLYYNKSMTTEFEEEYWKTNYSELEEMDCIGNVKEHANYIKALFELEQIEINSIADFGYGTGHLFKEVLQIYKPYKAYGLEPSKYMFERSSVVDFRPVSSTNLKLENIDLLTWTKSQKQKRKSYDLGLCNSVFQYISSEDLEEIIPVLSKSVKYLYLTVPTDKELKLQREDLGFNDTYSIKRSRKKYKKLIKPHFTFLSSRLLESKYHFDESNTQFQDLLYRF